MYPLSQLAGMKMDIFRCDGDKGMAGLPFQCGCAKNKFETFRRPRRIDGVGIRSVLAVNLQLRPPALSNYQLTPLGSAGGMPG